MSFLKRKKKQEYEELQGENRSQEEEPSQSIDDDSLFPAFEEQGVIEA